VVTAQALHPNGTPLVKLEVHARLDYWFAQACDVLLQLEIAALPEQRIGAAELSVNDGAPFHRVAAQDDVGTRLWVRAEGRLLVDYRAEVAIARSPSDYALLPRAPMRDLPAAAVQYLWPSRYCPSHRFMDFVDARFAGLSGGARVAAMSAWVAEHLSYVPGASTTDTTALDTFHDRAGVCRDYAHLMIALARAANIPARMVAVYTPGARPPDFHTVTEVFLGEGWHIVDPTAMASAADAAIIGVGRDAGDIAFLTSFGPLMLNGLSVTTRAV
jgi:transglutaminase-like putative cysteine protease